jgi:NADPH:quinone reductase-like Zn-dependent oxidoreductase
MKALTVNTAQKNSLQLKDVPVPSLNKNEVLIEMKAGSLNHRDLYVNNEWLKDVHREIIAGGDGAGVIVSLGEEVTGWKIGDEVMINPYLYDGDGPEEEAEFLGGPSNGTFCEYVKAPSYYLLRKPSYLTMEEAASMPLALSTAWGNVFAPGNELKDGETLLLQGIGGGVAVFILQLAVKQGVNVIVTSSSDKKLELAKSFGAVHGINYRDKNVAEEVMLFTNGKGADIVIDSSGKDSIESSLQALAENGRLFRFGSSTGGVQNDQLEHVHCVETGMVHQKELEKALVFYEKHQLHPILHDKVYSLEEFEDAYKVLEEGKQFGKIIMKAADSSSIL